MEIQTRPSAFRVLTLHLYTVLAKEAPRKKASFTLKKEKPKTKKNPSKPQSVKPTGPAPVWLDALGSLIFSRSPFERIGLRYYLQLLWGLTQVSVVNLEKHTGSFSFWHLLRALHNKPGSYWESVGKIPIYSILCNFMLSWHSLSPDLLSIFRYLVPNQVSICYRTCFSFLLNLCLEAWGRL